MGGSFKGRETRTPAPNEAGNRARRNPLSPDVMGDRRFPHGQHSTGHMFRLCVRQSHNRREATPVATVQLKLIEAGIARTISVTTE